MKIGLSFSLLVAALGLSVSACTVAIDPSSGASAASSGGSRSAVFLNRQERTAAFARANLERLRSDMAAGQGEHLSALAELLQIDAARQPAFFALTRTQFETLFPSERTTAAEMLTALDRVLQADPRFAGQRLSLN